MQAISWLLSNPIFGSVLGLLGIALAVVFYVRGRLVRRLVFQRAGYALIGRPNAALPSEVRVEYSGIPVPRVTKTIVILWNAGNVTLRRADITARDPLRIVLAEDTQILDAQVAKVRRDVNDFRVLLRTEDSASVYLDFDFLDSGDGARVEILHTGSPVGCEVRGTVLGMPQGCSDWGVIPSSSRSLGELAGSMSVWQQAFRRVLRRGSVVYLAMGLIGFTAIIAGLFPEALIALLPSLGRPQPKPLLQAGNVEWALVVLGIVYATPVSLSLWEWRRRHPTCLAPEAKA